MRERHLASVLLILTALALLTYLPLFHQPLLEDDYPNIAQAILYGPVSGWDRMFHDPLFRPRTTTWLMLYGINRMFGMHATAYYAAMILLHLLNTWLVYSLGVWRMLGYQTTAWAAAFFAISEAHQEAVMWVSASNEPLMLLFGLLSFICWIRFLDQRRALLYFASLLTFCLALLSKESAVILALIFVLPIALAKIRWQSAAYLAPFCLLALLSALSIFLNHSRSFRFGDGSFSLEAPFWLVWPENLMRLFWFWGLLSASAILIWRPAGYGRILVIGLSWMGIGLLPYSFLTYSTRIPSRQLYLASVGLALIVGFAMLHLYQRYWRTRRAIVVATCGALLVLNVGYLWTKKRSQFLARAEPTQELIALARSSHGPIYMKCFSRVPLIAESAVELMANRPGYDLVWDANEARIRHAAATFCYPDR